MFSLDIMIYYRTRSKEQSFNYCPLLVKIFFNTELSIIHVGAKYELKYEIM